MTSSFDWDADYDHLVRQRVVSSPRLRPAAAGRVRRWRPLSALAGFLAVAALALGAAALTPPEGRPAAMAALAAWPAQVLGLARGPAAEAIPAGLLAYDGTQYGHFRRGIARFSDADLLEYVRSTERLMTGGSPLAPLPAMRCIWPRPRSTAAVCVARWPRCAIISPAATARRSAARDPSPVPRVCRVTVKEEYR